GTGDLCAGMRISVSETTSGFVESACRYDADNAGATCTVTTAPTVYTASTTLGTTAAAQTLTSTLAAAASRYFKVQILFADGGRSSTISLSWSNRSCSGSGSPQPTQKRAVSVSASSPQLGHRAGIDQECHRSSSPRAYSRVASQFVR